MQLGIFAKTFAGTEPRAVLEAVREAGYATTQFNLACSGLDPMPDAVPAATVAAIRTASTETGVPICALSGTYNMAHPDAAVRADGLRRLGVVMETAAALDIPFVTLCTGTRDPHDQWRHHPDNADPSAWRDMAAEMQKALGLAERHGVDLGIEPEQANIVTSASDAMRLITEIGSVRLRIVLDPANLFETATTDEARTIVAAAVDEAGDRIAIAHAKDRHADGRFATAGKGIVDFADFFVRLKAAGFDGPVVTHGLAAENAQGVARLLKAVLP